MLVHFGDFSSILKFLLSVFCCLFFWNFQKIHQYQPFADAFAVFSVDFGVRSGSKGHSKQQRIIK